MQPLGFIEGDYGNVQNIPKNGQIFTKCSFYYFKKNKCTEINNNWTNNVVVSKNGHIFAMRS